MKAKRKCSECGESNLYTATVSAGGGYAPDLLPGAHPWWKGGKLELYVCGACGYLQMFVPAEGLAGVRESKKFKRA